MPTGVAGDFKIYQEQFHSGATEVLMQDTDVFNAASGGTIILNTKNHRGNYDQESFFTEISSLINHRDSQANSAAQQTPVTDAVMGHDDHIKVKLDRRIGPVLQTLDSFKKISRDPEEMSFILGEQWGRAIVGDYVNSALPAANAAFQQVHLVDGTAGTLNHANLVQGMAKFGDQGKNVKAFVMHSKQYYDLMNQSIADKIVDVASVTIHQGTIASLGRPVIVSDVAGLINTTPTPDEYSCLALMTGAITVEESEERNIVSQLQTGLPNLSIRYQGEYAYTLGLKGFSWDIANGLANPNNAALITGTNWDQVASDSKNIGGCVIKTQ